MVLCKIGIIELIFTDMIALILLIYVNKHSLVLSIQNSFSVHFSIFKFSFIYVTILILNLFAYFLELFSLFRVVHLL